VVTTVKPDDCELLMSLEKQFELAHDSQRRAT